MGIASRGTLRRGAWRAAAALAFLAGWAAAVWAIGGVYPQTKHAANPGVNRTSDWPVGSCEQCHAQHDGGSPNPFALFAPHDNALCASSGCHASSSGNGIYQGLTPYGAASHGTSTSVVWPGADATVDGSAPPSRPSGDWGKCVNCHDPHGYNRDGTGLIPSLLFSREEKPCLVCHDGSPAGKDIKTDFGKFYRHPIGTSGKHSVSEGGTSSKYGFTPTNNRHAECADCHNAHAAKSDPGPPTPPAASNRLLGVGRVSVINGAAGTVPTYTYRGPQDPTPAAEYEICFKCHSSWTTLPPTTPSGGPTKDKAVQFNPNNSSYHPVEAAGKNTNIPAGAFVSPWTARSLLYCTDCHSSDAATPIRGPHGSGKSYILKKDYATASASCLDCHQIDTYANNNAANANKGYSRFNPPAYGNGHTFHVGSRGYRCYACHESHGATTLPHLIVTGRTPGLNSYSQTANGGSCSPTCHGSKTYTINYAR